VSAHPHGNVVRLVNREGELVGEACPGCIQGAKERAQLARKITQLENEKAEKVHPLDKDIMAVCTFHKQLLSPTWKILRNRGAYNDVKACLGFTDAETGQPAYTPLHLKAASVGMSMDDWCRREGVRSASWLFSDVDRVDRMLQHAITFKRDVGVSALEIVDELGRPGLERLAARCDCCGHLRLDHERENPLEGLWSPPCGVHGCACPGFEDFDWRVQVRLAEIERGRAA
jgi:hypothetical protein